MVKPPMLVAAGAGFDDGLRLHAPGLQRHGDRDRLHGGAGLEGVGERPVAQLLAGQVLPPVGHVARVVRQRQHLAGGGVEHHHAAGLGLARDHAHRAASGRRRTAPCCRRSAGCPCRRRAASVSPTPSTTRPRRSLMTRREPGLAGQLLVEGELDAFLAVVFHVGEAHHVRGSLALGVLALVFLALVDALDVMARDLLGDRLVDLALEPDEGLVLVFELLVEILRRHPPAAWRPA